jgi:hypothetical protein
MVIQRHRNCCQGRGNFGQQGWNLLFHGELLQSPAPVWSELVLAIGCGKRSRRDRVLGGCWLAGRRMVQAEVVGHNR